MELEWTLSGGTSRELRRPEGQFIAEVNAIEERMQHKSVNLQARSEWAQQTLQQAGDQTDQQIQWISTQVQAHQIQTNAWIQDVEDKGQNYWKQCTEEIEAKLTPIFPWLVGRGDSLDQGNFVQGGRNTATE